MYRSLYAFRSAEPNSLHFAVGESFLILERSNKHWWLGSRCSSGETGYIPSSYIEKIQVNTDPWPGCYSLFSWMNNKRWPCRIPGEVKAGECVVTLRVALMGSRDTARVVTVLYVLQCGPRWSSLLMIVRNHKLLQRLHWVGTLPSALQLLTATERRCREVREIWQDRKI